MLPSMDLTGHLSHVCEEAHLPGAQKVEVGYRCVCKMCTHVVLCFDMQAHCCVCVCGVCVVCVVCMVCVVCVSLPCLNVLSL